MKYIILFLFPFLAFAQETFDKKNQLHVNFNQTNGYFKSNYQQDLSIEKNTELIKNAQINVKNSFSVSPLERQEERIPYEYDSNKSVGQNLVLEVVHNLFFSKPIRL